MDWKSFSQHPLPTTPPPPPPPPPIEEPSKKHTLKSSLETIESLRQENLELKLRLHSATEKGEFRLPTDKTIEREEPPPKSVKDAACQTHFDIINIDELMKASIILKRHEEEKHNAPYPRNSTPQPSHRPQKVQKLCYSSMILPDNQIVDHRLTDNTMVNQEIPKNDTLSRNLKPDEKSILETLYYVDGIMTTARDKLRAKSDIG